MIADHKNATIEELGKALKAKKISSAELTEAYLYAAKQKKHLNAYITICEESALQQAKKADELIHGGNELSPLCGIPIAIKDNICTRGVRTTAASEMLKDFTPPYSATVCERLSGAGAVLLGKTNMDEFAMGSSSTHSYFNAVKNPVNQEFVAGGSSGGSAAAVAADMCAAALGSDTGGSVRQPSAFCGVVGLKPTYGSVSRFGLIAFASSFDQIGPIAKTVKDCAIVLNQIAGADLKDSTCVLKNVPDYTAKIGDSPRGKRVCIIKQLEENISDNDVLSSLNTAKHQLVEAGCTVKTVSCPSLKYAASAYALISSCEAASNLARYDGVVYGGLKGDKSTFNEQLGNIRGRAFKAEVKHRIMLGNFAVFSQNYENYYLKALAAVRKIKSELLQHLKENDFFLMPTTPSKAFPINKSGTSLSMTSTDICTIPANLSGLPAITVPGRPGKNNMPVGVSLMGRAFEESDLFCVADILQHT